MLIIFIKQNKLIYNFFVDKEWGSNRTNNIDGAEVVRVAHNAILVSRMHLATKVLLCKQTTDSFQTRNPPKPRWRHLSGNRILFVPHSVEFKQKYGDEISRFHFIAN